MVCSCDGNARFRLQWNATRCENTYLLTWILRKDPRKVYRRQSKLERILLLYLRYFFFHSRFTGRLRDSVIFSLILARGTQSGRRQTFAVFLPLDGVWLQFLHLILAHSSVLSHTRGFPAVTLPTWLHEMSYCNLKFLKDFNVQQGLTRI